MSPDVDVDSKCLAVVTILYLTWQQTGYNVTNW